MFYKSYSFPILLCGLSLFFQACSTTHTVGTISDHELSRIEKGSPAEDLIAIWGEPEQIQTVSEDPYVIEAWIYTRETTKMDIVDTGTIEIPYVHPITGQDGVRQEIVSTPQTTTQKDTIIVYVSHGLVRGWKIQTKLDRDITR